MRKPNPAAAQLIESLTEALDSLGLHKCDSTSTLLAFDGGPEKRTAQTAGYLVDASLRVQAHHDVEPAVLVHDPYLGTIGLVEVLAGKDPGDYRQELERLIERATYLRQLALLEAERAPRRRALTVELVIVVPRDHAAAAGAPVSDILREIVRDTGYLEVIGVSLLYEQPAGGFSIADVRRAFAWLLVATRRWYSEDAAAAAAAQDPRRGWELLLSEYRHPGRRTYAFGGEPTCHVIHGYNGTGKSSFTEALELLLTGAIERLDAAGQTAYFPVVRYRCTQRTQPSEPVPSDDTDATAELRLGGATLVRATLSKSPVEGSELDHQVAWDGAAQESVMLRSPASFRLDQPTMDTLVRNSDDERAALFLRAFFPADRPLFDELEEARRVMDDAFDNLPEAVRAPATSGDIYHVIRQRIAWAAAPVEAWGPDTLQNILAACLPVTVAQKDLLGFVCPAVQDAFARAKAAPGNLDALETALKELDAALEGMTPRPATMLPHLDTALAVFRELEPWTATGQVHRGDSFESALNSWLELRALADLAAKQHEIAATLAAAQRAGWETQASAPSFARSPVGPDAVETLRNERNDLARARDLARAAVRRWSEPSSSADSPEGAPPATPARRAGLSSREIESLNLVGAWLPSVSPSQPAVKLGDVISSALAEDRSRGIGSLTIGSSGGLAPAIQQAGELRQACERLVGPNEGAAGMLRNCRLAAAAYDDYLVRQGQVQKTFLSEIAAAGKGGHLLNEALNELLALFKAAPWAYPDISLRAGHRGIGGEREELGIRTADNAKADLRLNTAELNSFTLALFLLCAPKLDNPIRIIVLDDPMQNMDEMTVSAIARGLAKLMMILPVGWQIVSLFHSEDDLRRVRDEVACAVYRLPWLVPAPSDTEPEIGFDAQDSTWTLSLQTLLQLQHSSQGAAPDAGGEMVDHRANASG
jgi:hypothetical protein